MKLREIPALDDALIKSLHGKVVDVLRQIVPRGRPLALLDFPRHNNVGDSAIWLGEIEGLAQCGVKSRDISYMADFDTYDEDVLRRSTGANGVILLHGGGNFGDLWPRYQRFRESVVAAFPGHRIIMLPQSIHFSEEVALNRAVEVFNRHPDLTILARDGYSLQFLNDHFSTQNHLCPDMAFCLGPLARPNPDCDVVYLARTDKESNSSDLGAALRNNFDISSFDWPELDNAWQWRAGAVLAQFQADHPRMVRLLDAPVTAAVRKTYYAMAAERLNVGCALLAQGRVAVVDRLHAHILAVLMGIPHVVLDNSYGKIGRFRETWTSESRLTREAHTREEALEIAYAMLRSEV